MLISFIIPVYNVVPYLEHCVRSILSQRYRDIELLLINDGSTDGSAALCDELSTSDKRIRVIHQHNQGLSAARNNGLAAARGEYIVFVDSDDYWYDCEDLSSLVSIAESSPSLEVIGFNCRYYYPKTGRYVDWLPYSAQLSQVMSMQEAFRMLNTLGTIPMSACLKMIKRSTLLEHGIRFEVGRIAEDIPWFIDLVEHVQSCCFINRYVYVYRQNVSNSITQSHVDKRFEHLMCIIESEVTKASTRNIVSTTKDALYSFLAYELSILYSIVADTNDVEGNRKRLGRYAWLLQYTTNPKVKKASYVHRLIGLRGMEWVLRIYNKMRERIK